MVKKNKKTENSSNGEIKRLLQNQIDHIVEIFDDRMEIVKDGFKSVHEKLDSHEKKIDNLSGKIDNLYMDMIEVKSDIGQIKFDIKLQLENKVDVKHFVGLEQRVRILEKK